MRGPTARDKLIQSAEKLMLAKGYPATAVDEICADAGVSKGSFYHFFETKEALGLAVLEAYYRTALTRLDAGPHADIADPVERANAFLDHLVTMAHQFWGNGCLLGSFAIDLAETNQTIREAVSETFSKATENFARALEPLCEGDGGAGWSAEQLAEQFVVVLEGALVLAKAHKDWSYVTRALERFRRGVGRRVGVSS